jgi:putative selenate reductase molybdopterin-binding subunit
MNAGTASLVPVTINGVRRELAAGRKERLLDVLRREGYVSVKRGCDTGDCGVCVVLLDGLPVRSCMVRAIDAKGRFVTTVEALRSPDGALHPIQRSFVETGAIQCGYCTPAQILIAAALLAQNPEPSEAEIREALSGVLCRCTGYVRVIEAVQRAAALLRGENVQPVTFIEQVLPDVSETPTLPERYCRREAFWRGPLPPLVYTPREMEKTSIVGKPAAKVDAAKLAQGRAVFADDIQPAGMLYGALLTSPHAHARIRDASTPAGGRGPARGACGADPRRHTAHHVRLRRAELPATAALRPGQPGRQGAPRGDRVAVVAAETPEIAQGALRLIEVDYELLPAVLDP